MNNHRTTVTNKKHNLLAEHFNGEGGCNVSHLVVQPIEQMNGKGIMMKSERLKRESYWIKELRTLTPYGLNDRLGGRNWIFRWRDDIAGQCFNKLSNVRGTRGRRTQKRTIGCSNRTIKTFDSDKILKELSLAYDDLQNWRLLARSKVNTIKHNDLITLSWIFVEHYHNVHTTYPREITNLMLDMINYRILLSKKKKKQTRRTNFVKVFFQSKEVEKVNLGSIFRKHLEAIPSSFKHTDPPTVLYQRSKPISSTIFNYKHVVDNVNTDDWKYNNNHTCDCEKSVFCDTHHQHIVTGDLRVITNKKLRPLLMKGPGYRESKKINWGKFLIAFKTSLNDCVNKWADSENVDSCYLDE
jgi:hypothetical protein